eukprot:TRINITY_DN27347_c0_g1_i1.p1 TRINITY_DN27347_c0_g1~~TRINITY_DN27347_c0_g1_i1.p1  ORF type:complete len:831 (+),score=159.84 TRINITY_DN27347_c0_g1_i1:40-2532(+)
MSHLLMRLALALGALCGAAHGHGDVPHWVEEVHRSWGGAYNAGDREALAEAHTRTGVVVPPSADKIVPNAEFVKGGESSLPKETYLVPTHAVYEPPGEGLFGAPRTYHVVGVYMSGGRNATYYSRMEALTGVHNPTWRFDTLVFRAPGALHAAGVEVYAPAWLDKAWMELYDVAQRLPPAAVAAAFFTKEAAIAPADGGAVIRPASVSDLEALSGLVHTIAVSDRRDGTGDYDVVGEATLPDGTAVRAYFRWTRTYAEGRRHRIETWVPALAVSPAKLRLEAAGTQRPPHWLTEMEGAYGRAFASQDFERLATMHMQGGVIVPRAGDRLVPGRNAYAYLKEMWQQGMVMQLETQRAVAAYPQLVGAPSIFHTVGVNRGDGSVYYMRWRGHHDFTPYHVSVLALGVGRFGGLVGSGNASPPPEWMTAALDAMTAAYAASDFHRVTATYSPTAVVVPHNVAPANTRLVERTGLAAFLAGAAPHGDVPMLAMRATEVYAQDDGYHMLGTAQAVRTNCMYRVYMRWELSVNGTWQVESHLMSLSMEINPVGAGVVSQRPPHWLAEMEGAYGRAFEAKDLDALAAMHTPQGVIVPHTGDRFVLGQDASTYLRELWQDGVGMQLVTVSVVRRPPVAGDVGTGAAVAYHSLGINMVNAGVYYARWEEVEGKDGAAWRINTMIFGVGSGNGFDMRVAVPHVTVAEPPQWMTTALDEMSAMYAAGSFDQLAAAYSGLAVITAYEANTAYLPLLDTDALSTYLKGVSASGEVPMLGMRATEVYAEGTEVYHMLGTAHTATVNCLCRVYMRWRREWDGWRVETHVMSVGDPKAWWVPRLSV